MRDPVDKMIRQIKPTFPEKNLYARRTRFILTDSTLLSIVSSCLTPGWAIGTILSHNLSDILQRSVRHMGLAVDPVPNHRELKHFTTIIATFFMAALTIIPDANERQKPHSAKHSEAPVSASNSFIDP